MTYAELVEKISELSATMDKLDKAILALNSGNRISLRSNTLGYNIYDIRPGSGIAGRLAEDLGKELLKVQAYQGDLLNLKDRIDTLLEGADAL